MNMALAGMAKDERQASGTRLLEGGQLGKKLAFNMLYRLVMIKNLSGDVVGCAEGKGCWTCLSVPGGREGVN